MDNELAVVERTAIGRKVKRLRRTGQVPAVVYGKGSPSVSVQVEAKVFDHLYRVVGRTSLVNLQVNGGPAKSAIIKSVQRHPLTRQPLHVDFFLVDLKQEMEVDTPLVFTGEPPAIEQTGGTLMTALSQVRVRALPAELPHEIVVDVTPLVDLDAAIHVRDLPVPPNVTIQTDGDELVAKVLPPRVEEEEEVVAEEEELEEGAEEGAPAEGQAEGEPQGERASNEGGESEQ
jgi:large subunit ribosomal protein L25